MRSLILALLLAPCLAAAAEKPEAAQIANEAQLSALIARGAVET